MGSNEFLLLNPLFVVNNESLNRQWFLYLRFYGKERRKSRNLKEKYPPFMGSKEGLGYRLGGEGVGLASVFS
jgi:hypothetical protein